MQRRYVTVDVFTDRRFGGNPLAVVLDAEGLSSAEMQAIASEFNYSETTFVLVPRAQGNAACLRIFTSRVEVPFAGHPNVGTAVVLAQDREASGEPPVAQFVFEEAAGLVPVRLTRTAGRVTGAEFTAPERLSSGPAVPLDAVADCIGLAPGDILTTAHPPRVLSVGLPFLVVELTGRDALRRAKPKLSAHETVLPPLGTDAIYCYVRDPQAQQLQARMFSPLDACVEDPATGSATAATISLLATISPEHEGERTWRIEQGVDMGRPSLLLGRTEKRDGTVVAAHVGGQVVEVMCGTLQV